MSHPRAVRDLWGSSQDGCLDVPPMSGLLFVDVMAERDSTTPASSCDVADVFGSGC